MHPGFIWGLANYSLRIGDNEKALDGFAQYLRLVPSAREETFSLASRGIHDPLLIWEKVVHISRDPQTELAYLNFYKKQDAQAETAQLWSEIMAEGKPFPASAAIPYVDRLLEALEYGQAKSAWTDMQAKGIIRAKPAEGELAFNGNFEEKPLHGGFDWHLQEQSYLYMDVAQPGSCRNSATARPPSKPRVGLYVVGEDETPPETEPTESKKAPAMKVAAATASGDMRSLLEALSARLASSIDNPNTPARDLAALSRRLLETQREIKALDADEDDDEVGEAARTPDGKFDPAAI